MASSAKQPCGSRETIPSTFIAAYVSNDKSYIAQFNFRVLLYLDESGKFYYEVNINPSGHIPIGCYQPPSTIATLRPRSLIQIEGPGEAFRLRQYNKLKYVVVKEDIDQQEVLPLLWDHFNKAQQAYFKYLTTVMDKTKHIPDLRHNQLLPRSSHLANDREFCLNMLLGVVSDIEYPTTEPSVSHGRISFHILSDKAIADREQQDRPQQHHSSSQSLPLSSSSFSTIQVLIIDEYGIPLLPQVGDVCLILTTKYGYYSTHYPLITSQQLLSDFAQQNEQSTPQQQRQQPQAQKGQPQQGHFTIGMLDDDDDSETGANTTIMSNSHPTANVKKFLGELFDFHQQQVKICTKRHDNAKDITYTAYIEDYQKIVAPYQEKKREEEELKMKQQREAEEKRKQQHLQHLQYLQHLEQIEEEKQFIFSTLQHHHDHNILPVAHQVITQYPFLSAYITTNIITPFLQYQSEVRQFFLDNYPKTKNNNENNNENNSNTVTKNNIIKDHSGQNDAADDDDEMMTTTTTTTTTTSTANPTTSTNTTTTSQHQHYQQQYEYLPLPTTTLMWRDYLDWIMQHVQPDLVALSSPGLTAMLFQTFADQHHLNNNNHNGNFITTDKSNNNNNNQIPLLQHSLLSILSPHRYGRDPSHGRTPQLAEHKMKRTLSSLSRLWDHGYEKEEQADNKNNNHNHNNNNTLLSLKRKKPDPTIPNNITSTHSYQSNMNDGDDVLTTMTNNITTTTTTLHSNPNNTLLLGSQSIFPVTDADTNVTSLPTSKLITPFTVQNIPLQQFLQQQDAALLQHFSSASSSLSLSSVGPDQQQQRQHLGQSHRQNALLLKDHTAMTLQAVADEWKALFLEANHRNDVLLSSPTTIPVDSSQDDIQPTTTTLNTINSTKHPNDGEHPHDSTLTEQIRFLKAQLEAKDKQLEAKDKQMQQLLQLLSGPTPLQK